MLLVLQRLYARIIISIDKFINAVLVLKVKFIVIEM